MDNKLKKILVVVGAILGAIALIFIIWFSYNRNMNTNIVPGIEGFKTKRVLIAYYDRNGETELIAKVIHDTVGGDLVKLEPVSAYPEEENKYLERLKKEKHNETPVVLKKRPIARNYDIIFVGTPIELFTMLPPVKTFLVQNDFSKKVVIPFVVYKKSGYGNVLNQISDYAANSYIKNSYLNNISEENPYLQNSIASWINTMSFKRYQLK